MGWEARVPWAVLESSVTGVALVLAVAAGGGPCSSLTAGFLLSHLDFSLFHFPADAQFWELLLACYRQRFAASYPGREFRPSGSLFTEVCVLSLSSSGELTLSF